MRPLAAAWAGVLAMAAASLRALGSDVEISAEFHSVGGLGPLRGRDAWLWSLRASSAFAAGLGERPLLEVVARGAAAPPGLLPSSFSFLLALLDLVLLDVSRGATRVAYAGRRGGPVMFALSFSFSWGSGGRGGVAYHVELIGPPKVVPLDLFECLA